MLRTNDIKALAEEWEDEYQEYVDECKKLGNTPQDIFTWVVTEQMTAEEEDYQYKKDEGLL